MALATVPTTKTVANTTRPFNSTLIFRWLVIGVFWTAAWIPMPSWADLVIVENPNFNSVPEGERVAILFNFFGSGNLGEYGLQQILFFLVAVPFRQRAYW